MQSMVEATTDGAAAVNAVIKNTNLKFTGSDRFVRELRKA